MTRPADLKIGDAIVGRSFGRLPIGSVYAPSNHLYPAEVDVACARVIDDTTLLASVTGATGAHRVVDGVYRLYFDHEAEIEVIQ